MRPDARLGAAVLAGKLAATASRGLGRGGGTTVPGDVALAIDPGVLAKLGSTLPRGSVLVTGTNGKTTTTGLIAAVLGATGERVLTNASGANLVFGLVAAAVAQARPMGGARADRAVFEVDELSLERAVVELRPRLVVVLNLLRDQLDRSGELQTTARRIGDGLRRLPEGARIVANADDPLVVGPCEGLPGVVYVGIDADDQVLDAVPHAADARSCPHCGAALAFDRVVLAHCGSYRCTACDFARPRPALTVRRITATSLDSQRLELCDGTVLSAAVAASTTPTTSSPPTPRPPPSASPPTASPPRCRGSARASGGWSGSASTTGRCGSSSPRTPRGSTSSSAPPTRSAAAAAT